MDTIPPAHTASPPQMIRGRANTHAAYQDITGIRSGIFGNQRCHWYRHLFLPELSPCGESSPHCSVDCRTMDCLRGEGLVAKFFSQRRFNHENDVNDENASEEKIARLAIPVFLGQKF